ncbi:MAG: hypothetical protein ACYDG4_04190 [Desulfuromonadaceae bacterium]
MSPQNQAVTPLSIDIDNVICDMNRLFNPLHKDFMLDYQVQAYRDGYVLLTIALPEGMTKVFSSMLESMSGFFHFMHIKSKTVKASALATEPAEIARREKLQTEFKDETCRLFDGFIVQGLSIKEAVSLTNSALKEQMHPWANYDAITRTLRSTGRFRRDFLARLGVVLKLSTSP